MKKEVILLTDLTLSSSTHGALQAIADRWGTLELFTLFDIYGGNLEVEHKFQSSDWPILP